MFLNILIGLDGSASSRRALEAGVDLARAANAKLTLIVVAPPVSSYVTLAGISTLRMESELEQWAADLLKTSVESMPEGVVAHTIQRAGDAGPEIVKELKQGNYDLIVLGTRGRGRTQEGLLGSVNGYVHFHSHVPLLSVPDDGAAPRVDHAG